MYQSVLSKASQPLLQQSKVMLAHHSWSANSLTSIVTTQKAFFSTQNNMNNKPSWWSRCSKWGTHREYYHQPNYYPFSCGRYDNNQNPNNEKQHEHQNHPFTSSSWYSHDHLNSIPKRKLDKFLSIMKKWQTKYEHESRRNRSNTQNESSVLHGRASPYDQCHSTTMSHRFHRLKRWKRKLFRIVVCGSILAYTLMYHSDNMMAILFALALCWMFI